MTTRSSNPDNRGIDALLPAEIAEKAEAVGIQKTKLDVLSLLALAILAGAFIALGAMFATTVLARISHTVERIGAPNQRKLFCDNDFF